MSVAQKVIEALSNTTDAYAKPSDTEELMEGHTLSTPSGSMLIAIERARQLRVKQYDASHDKQYTDNFLSQWASYFCTGNNNFVDAAQAFTDYADVINTRESTDATPSMRDLIRAGALIAAEIDRRTWAMSKDELEAFKKSIKW